MFHRLHLQLTALCIAITGLVLAVLSCICLFISESGIRRQEYASFLASLSTMYQNLEQQSSLSHTWIRQMEHNHGFHLRISDNGAPLFFQSLEADDIPDALWRKAETAARADCGLDLQNPGSLSVLTRHTEFPLTDSGENYNASVALIPRSGGYIGVIALQPLAPVEARIHRQRAAFVLADLAALALLGVFYWHFTRRMIRPLAESRKKQMQFVASASHELRSPLAVILSNVSAVKSGAMPGDAQFLRVIESEGARMSRLITDMLQLAGADNHTWSIHPAEVEMDTLLLQVFERFEPAATARGLRWEISLPEESVPRCVCDEERIRQLLAILVENAFSYTPSGGCVRLSLSVGPFPGRAAGCHPSGHELPREQSSARPARRSFLRLAVSDNGPGIPDCEKKAVFERFGRLDRSRTDKSHFGLGLCIAQEIARLHRGRIRLTDTPGGGATFTVELPFDFI